MSEREIAAAAAKAPLVAIAQPQPWYVDRAWMQAARERIVRTVREFHQKTSAAARHRHARSCAAARRVFVLDALLADAKEIVAEGETGALARPQTGAQGGRGAGARQDRAAFEEAGLAVPAMAEVLAKSGVEAARARSLLQILLREKRLVRISDDLVFHQTAIEQLRELLAAAQGRTLRRAGVQGVDRHLAQVRHPAAGVSGPREGHAPRRRSARV